VSRASPLELRPDYWISTIIKGYGHPGGARRHLSSIAALDDMTAFVDAGVTTIDCGDGEPGFERLAGSFRQDVFRTHGLATARALRLHTQFVPDLAAPGAFGQDQVETAIDQSLTRLGVDTLDMVQLHWPIADTSHCLDALGYLSLMQAKGKILHLGVTNFDVDHLRMFVQSGIDIVAAQVPFSLIDQRPRGDYAELCREHNIALLAYGTLAGGFFSNPWLGAPDPGYSFETPVLARHRLVIEAFGGWGLFQELLLALGAIASRHGVTIEGVALRAMHDHADVSAVILRSADADRFAGHLKAFDFTPTERDREALAAVLARKRGPSGPVFGMERTRTQQNGGFFNPEFGTRIHR
jgi:aryl-alcohol dehydrogenase-like predicted oxidoreductase